MTDTHLFVRSPKASGIVRVAITTLALASIIGAYALTGFVAAYGIPIADDFCRGVIGSSNSLAYANDLYLNWTGRWTSMLIESALFSAFDLYRSVPFILLGMFCFKTLSLALFFRGVCSLTIAYAALAATLLQSVYLATCNSPAETVFWATGALEYELPLSLTLIAFSLVAIRSRRGYIIAALLVLVSVTSNELVGLINFLAWSCLAWFRYMPNTDYDRGEVKKALGCALLSLAGLAFIALSPGTAARKAVEFSGGISRLDATVNPTLDLLRWITAGPAIGLCLTFLSVPLLPALSSAPWTKMVPFLAVPFGLSPILILGLGQVPSAGRVKNLLCFSLLLGLVFFAAWLGAQMQFDRRIFWIGLLVTALSVISSRNLKDLAISAAHVKAWKAQVEAQSRLTIREPQTWPPVFFKNEVTPDKSHWRNRCYDQYHQIEGAICQTCPVD